MQKPSSGKSLTEISSEAEKRFYQELQKEAAQKATRAREQRIPKDEVRIQKALEAVIIEAQRIARYVQAQTILDREEVQEDTLALQGIDQKTLIGTMEMEVPVQSKDALLRGRIDCVEYVPQGARLIDYKSALRADLPERYERQLQLYALLWHETRNEWAHEAYIIYPFTNMTYTIAIDPVRCERVGTEARSLIARLQRTASAEKLAMPGEVCKVCEFRPWCKPFWQWQTSETSFSLALERASWGLKGLLLTYKSSMPTGIF